MNYLDIFKALSNEKRLQILDWLKEPEKNFPPQGLHIPEGDSFDKSVCVGSIQEKAGISQSTVYAACRTSGIRPIWEVDILPEK